MEHEVDLQEGCKRPDPAYQLENGLENDEEDLSEDFKARIGLLGDERIGEVTEVEVALAEEKDIDLKTYTFHKFAQSYFIEECTNTYSKQPLRHPLINKKHEVDRLASLAVWLGIQRFMGDIPTRKENLKCVDKTPIITKVHRTLEAYSKRRKTSSSSQNGDSDAAKEKREYVPFKLQKRSSIKRLFSSQKSSTSSEKKEPLARSHSGSSSGDLLYSTDASIMGEEIPQNQFDLVHFVIGHGILRKDLRDEILCQVCKQLTENPGRDSQTQGWILLALCSGCFVPTELFMNYYKSFLKQAPNEYEGYARYSLNVLNKVITKGIRYHPPNWMEYQATKLRRYVMLPVTYSDGRVETLEADPATTAADLCSKLANKAGLKDAFGFSIYISIFDKVSSLGCGSDHVMDAISECEQLILGKKQNIEDAPWRLYYRKEMFTPWYDPGYDEVATNLVYKQICRGIKSEEYRTRNDPELARFVARRYFIEHGKDIIPGKVQSIVHKYLPASALTGSRTRDHWTPAVIASFVQQDFNKDTASEQDVKNHIARSSCAKWPLQFSGLFEAFKIAGPRLPKNEVIIAINSKGIYILDEPYRIMLGFNYYEIVEVSSSRTLKMRGQSFSVVTVKGDEFSFISPNASTIAKLISYFLDGLRMRSKYAVGLQEYVLQGEGADRPFCLVQGDIIEILDEEVEGQKEDWCYGKNERTGETGLFPCDAVYFLATMVRPPDKFLNLFSVMTSKNVGTLSKKRGTVLLSKGTIGRHGYHGKESAA